MQYRNFGGLDWQVSVLGFGCMRLPTLGEPSSTIDEAETTRMLRYAIERGVNYLDTAYAYGDSERVLGRALRDGYRARIRLATKAPHWLYQVADDFDRYLDEQLERLQTPHIDFYLFHALNADNWARLRTMQPWAQAERAVADGRIGYLGFSFHDDTAVLREIIDEYDGWTVCQIQHNYMDVQNQAGTAGLRYAASKGLATVIMEPLLGGRLARAPEKIQKLWNESQRQWTPVAWALYWLWDQPAVSVVLSGMTTMAQVEENIAYADRAATAMLTEADQALIARVRTLYESLCPIPCTACGYCLPCPNGVNIPRNFRIYNEGVMYSSHGDARGWYRNWLTEADRASACIECQHCEEICPQDIPISQWMPLVHQVLGEGHDYYTSLP